MSFWLICLILFVVSFLVTEAYLRVTHKKKVVVRIKHKDGTESLVEIYPGRDLEADQLIKKIKKKRGMA